MGLRPLCDIAVILQRHKNGIDWPQVRARAMEWRAGKCVYLSLWLAKELVRADVPALALKSLRPSDFNERWSNLARHQVALAGGDPVLSEPIKSALLPFMKLGAAPAHKCGGAESN